MCSEDGTDCGTGAACQVGACLCPSHSYACPDGGSLCCANGQACLGGPTCGSCPAVPEPCNVGPQCGQFGDNPDTDLCFCVTSVQGTPYCNAGYGKCVACTADDQCTQALGAPGLCVDVSVWGCASCDNGITTLCLYAACAAPPDAGDPALVRLVGGNARPGG